MTLSKYIDTQGSNEAAARMIGVSLNTVRRWHLYGVKPRGLSLKRLKKLGIEL